MYDGIHRAIDKAFMRLIERRQLGQVIFAVKASGGHAQRAAELLANWLPDRVETEARMRHTWTRAEKSVWTGDVFEVWQEMAEEYLARNVFQGMDVVAFPVIAA